MYIYGEGILYPFCDKSVPKGLRADLEILSLTDNLCALPGCKAQHGLSLYIKTQKHTIRTLPKEWKKHSAI